MHTLPKMLERRSSMSSYIFSHSLVTAISGKTASIWHRYECAAFISVFSFLLHCNVQSHQKLFLDVFVCLTISKTNIIGKLT